MKRIMLGLFSAIALFLGLISVVSADVNDFVITDFTADYYLSKDEDSHSLLKTVESITVDFPSNQNHGIERTLPQAYDGHSTSLTIDSVVDESGNNLKYSKYDNDGDLVIRIGDADTYVSGIKTYIITYNQKNVTKFYADTQDDEFYWDVNGTKWLQHFDNVSVRVHLSEDLAHNLTDKQSCYFGLDKSVDQCSIAKDESTGVISATAKDLLPNENMTIAIGFISRTFAECETDSHAYTNINDFTITDFTADYYLSKDEGGHSLLKTVESITAEFPQYDQNHGIERKLKQSYNGHSVNLYVESIKNQDGVGYNYYKTIEDDYLVLRIGDADNYVHGPNSYIITYYQHDVTRYFGDADEDEFYWNVNGNGWAQSFSSVTARVHLDSSIIDNFNLKQSCYFGLDKSVDQCSITKDESTGVISATAKDLLPNENMTIAIGFIPRTFAEYEMNIAERLGLILGTVYLFGCPLLAVAIFILKRVRLKNAKVDKILVVQYKPPMDVDIMTSAFIIKKNKKAYPAVLVNLAVNKKISIEYNKKKNKYSARLLSFKEVSSNEKEVLQKLFGKRLDIGSNVDFSKTNYSLNSKMHKYFYNLWRDLINTDYFENKEKLTKSIYVLSAILMFNLICVGLFILIWFIKDSDVDTYLSLAFSYCVFFVPYVIFTLISLTHKKPMSAKGGELKNYLMGVKMYIRTAEQDRISILQSPNGSEKVNENVKNGKETIKLYEKLLPYAILFGLEKKWEKVLSIHYQEQGSSLGDTYSYSDIVVLSSFSSSLPRISSSYSSGNSSGASSGGGDFSSSGGSSGGGSSGGGGGGGGGGGW